MNKKHEELTFEEFCQLPMQYTLGMSGDYGAHRLHRNEAAGIQKETFTRRKRQGDIYSGWAESNITYFMDGDERQFETTDALYVAWMEKVCGIKEKT